jgi:hypothetical protein
MPERHDRREDVVEAIRRLLARLLALGALVFGKARWFRCASCMHEGEPRLRLICDLCGLPLAWCDADGNWHQYVDWESVSGPHVADL